MCALDPSTSRGRWPRGSGPGSSRSRALARPAEQGLHLDRESHVALDLQLALHEGGGPVELAGHDLDPVAGVSLQGQVRRRARFALARLGFAVLDVHPPLAAPVTAQVERDHGVRAAGLFGDEEVGHRLDYLVGGHLNFGHRTLPEQSITLAVRSSTSEYPC